MAYYQKPRESKMLKIDIRRWSSKSWVWLFLRFNSPDVLNLCWAVKFTSIDMTIEFFASRTQLSEHRKIDVGIALFCSVAMRCTFSIVRARISQIALESCIVQSSSTCKSKHHPFCEGLKTHVFSNPEFLNLERSMLGLICSQLRKYVD